MVKDAAETVLSVSVLSGFVSVCVCCSLTTELCVCVCVSGRYCLALLVSVHDALVGRHGTKHLQTGDQKTTAAAGRRPGTASPRQITHAEVRPVPLHSRCMTRSWSTLDWSLSKWSSYSGYIYMQPNNLCNRTETPLSFCTDKEQHKLRKHILLHKHWTHGNT